MDALEVVHGLEKAGFSRPQAEAITEAVERATLGPSANIATKDDLARVETALKAELKQEIAAVHAELHKEIGALAWKAAGLLLAQAAFIIAVLKLTP